MMSDTRRRMLLTPLVMVLAACGVNGPPLAVVETQTNEQGCVRVRSTGPQDPAAIPVPIKQACVGPYLLELPQNYFYNQMGTEFDGSFALALEYPSLEPFKPGERERHDVNLRVRTAILDFVYIDRIDIQQAMRNQYTPMSYQKGDPAASLETRLVGEPIFGLKPYYADMERIRAHRRAMGLKEDAPGMQDAWYTDWFISRGENGEVENVIKCTSRNVTEPGVVLQDGKMARVRGVPVAECDHTFVIIDHGTMGTIKYARVALPDWRRIESRARKLFRNNITETVHTTQRP